MPFKDDEAHDRYYRAYYQTNKRTLKDKALRRRYGIGLDTVEQMLAAQAGLCAICQTLMKAEGRDGNSMHIDHDHTTGAVRGLLCSHCNTMLGLAKYSVQTLQAAQRYLSDRDSD